MNCFVPKSILGGSVSDPEVLTFSMSGVLLSSAEEGSFVLNVRHGTNFSLSTAVPVKSDGWREQTKGWYSAVACLVAKGAEGTEGSKMTISFPVSAGAHYPAYTILLNDCKGTGGTGDTGDQAGMALQRCGSATLSDPNIPCGASEGPVPLAIKCTPA